jgi:hypothetical protein
MQIYIDKDEWYPVRVPVEDAGDSWLSKHYKLIDAPDDIMSRWNNLVTEFNLFQEELKELSKAS